MTFLEHSRAVIESMAPSPWRDRVLAFLDGDGEPGHLTGSALVVDAARAHLLVLYHRKLRRWLQPGGHVEDGDADLAATALREASEESGIIGLSVEPVPIDVDVHWVGTHFHYDLRFVVVAPPDAQPCGNHESDEIRWIRPDQLDEIDADESLRRLVAAATPSFFADLPTSEGRESEKNG